MSNYRFIVYDHRGRPTSIEASSAQALQPIRDLKIAELDAWYTIGMIQIRIDNEWQSLPRYGLEKKGKGHKRYDL